MSAERRVEDLMSGEVAVLDVNDSLSIADDVMRLGRIRHMPVVEERGEEQILAGIISQRDLFRGALGRVLGYGSRAQDRLLAGLLVKEVMTSKVVTAGREMPAREAAQLMLERKIGCLVVVEQEQVVGILTESDFVKLFLEDR